MHDFVIRLGGFASLVFCAAVVVRGGVEAANVGVDVKDNFFDDASVTVTVGDTVTWTWVGSNLHTVTADDASFDSGSPQSSGTFAHTFSTAGSFGYFCAVHGPSMSGTVVVQAAPTATSTVAATSTTAAASATATQTPAGTPTRTVTPQASVTQGPGVTAAAATTTPVVAVPISATQPAGGAAPIGAPRTGDGSPSAGGDSLWLPVVLAATGVALLSGWVVVGRRGR